MFDYATFDDEILLQLIVIKMIDALGQLYNRFGREEGYRKLHIDHPPGLTAYTDFGVTIEPTGGSPAPAGEKVLGLDL